MVMADFAIILNLTSEISLNKLINRTAAASHHSNAVSAKDILCPLTNIARKHYLNTHLVKHRSNARFASGFGVGTRVMIWGRVQSREYTKKITDTECEKRTAYEVSVSKLECVE